MRIIDPKSIEGALGIKDEREHPIFITIDGNEFIGTAFINEKKWQMKPSNDDPELQIPQNLEIFDDIVQTCLNFGCITLRLKNNGAGKLNFSTAFDMAGSAKKERGERIILELQDIFDSYPIENEVLILLLYNVTYYRNM
jgi:hypothetical protein